MSRVGSLLNRRVEIWRETTTDDGGGGQTSAWALRYEHRARLSQPSARERQAAHQSGSELTHTAYFKPGADVQRADQIRTYDGRVLEVIAVFEPSVSGTYLRADCTARQQQGDT